MWEEQLVDPPIDCKPSIFGQKVALLALSPGPTGPLPGAKEKNF